MDIKILIPIAQGTEELELVAITDILRRANLSLKIAGENEIVTCSRGLKIIPDILLDNIEEDDYFDAIIIPGGLEGVNNLRNNEYFMDLLKRHNNDKNFFGAICAAPLIFDSAKILKLNQDICCHPSVETQLENYNILNDNVVISGNIITSRGAGTSIEFAFAIIENLVNKETAQNIAEKICFKYD